MDFEKEKIDLEIFKDKSLGSGAYGMVCRATYNQLPCAAKLLHSLFLTPESWAVDKFVQECDFLSSLKHPNIVQFLGVHTDPSTNQTALLMELMDESLTTLLSRHSLDHPVPLHTQVDVCHDISLALHYLHINAIIHRDLSSNNVLLLGGRRAKLTDFGMSKLTPNSTPLLSMTQVPGCPVYMPPEAWVTPPIYTNKLDIFSMGVIMVQVATCKVPNPGPMEELIPDQRSPTGYLKLPVSEVDRRSEDIALVSGDHPLQEMVIKCLNDKPDSRPTAKELCQQLNTLKISQQYIGSSNVTEDSSTMSSGYSSVSNMQFDSLKCNLDLKETEVQTLKSQLAACQLEINNLKMEIKKRDATITELQKASKEEKKGLKQLVSGGVEIMTVTGLSPEVLAIFSRSLHQVELGCDIDIARGSVTCYSHPDKMSTDYLTVFLQMYEHKLNCGCVKTQYVSIPPTFTRESLPSAIETCLACHQFCHFEYVDTVNMIKVVSKSSKHLKLSCQLLENILHRKIALHHGRIFRASTGDIVTEQADAIMSLTMPNLTCAYGLSNKLNMASLFQLQKHCQDYIKKNGNLKVAQAVNIPASGNLKCKWIIFAVNPGSSYLQESSSSRPRMEIDRLLREMVHNVLAKAERLKLSSLVLCEMAPKIIGSTDNLGAVAVMETILNFKYGHLKEIRMVFNRDTSRIGYQAYLEVIMKHSSHFTKQQYLMLKDEDC